MNYSQSVVAAMKVREVAFKKDNATCPHHLLYKKLGRIQGDLGQDATQWEHESCKSH